MRVRRFVFVDSITLARLLYSPGCLSNKKNSS
jgi:hypothetical protein